MLRKRLFRGLVGSPAGKRVPLGLSSVRQRCAATKREYTDGTLMPAKEGRVRTLSTDNMYQPMDKLTTVNRVCWISVKRQSIEINTFRYAVVCPCVFVICVHTSTCVYKPN